MKSLFDLGLKKSFMAKSGVLGQEGSGFITSYDEGPPSESYPGMYTSYEEGPPATSYPGMYTSYDEGPPAEHVPGIVTQRELQEWLNAPTPSTDWSKVATTLLKSAGDSYVAYAKAQSSFDAARAKVGLSPLPLKTAASQNTAINPNVIFLVGGLAIVGILAVVLARK